MRGVFRVVMGAAVVVVGSCSTDRTSITDPSAAPGTPPIVDVRWSAGPTPGPVGSAPAQPAPSRIGTPPFAAPTVGGRTPDGASVSLSPASMGARRTEFVWQHTTTGDRGMWRLQGSTFVSWIPIGVVDPIWQIGCVASFTGGAVDDLVWTNTATGERAAWGMSNGQFASYAGLPSTPAVWRISACGDVNDDGRTDLLFTNTSTGERGAWLMNGTTVTAWLSWGVVPLAWHLVAVADMSGDGVRDIVWSNASTGERGAWVLQGAQPNGWRGLGQVATDWQLLAVRPFDDDAEVDLFWRYAPTGETGFWRLVGGTFAGWSGAPGAPDGWSLGGAGVLFAAAPSVPTVPSAPTVGNATTNSLTVLWNPVVGATSYDVQRAANSTGPFTSLGAQVSGFVNSGLTSTTTYWYQVRACNATGCSEWSSAASGTTSSTPNSPPTISFLAPADNSTHTNERPLAVSVSVGDPDGDAVSVSWASDRDGPLAPTTTNAELTLSAGAHVITARATDARGASVSATRRVTIVTCASGVGGLRHDPQPAATGVIGFALSPAPGIRVLDLCGNDHPSASIAISIYLRRSGSTTNIEGWSRTTTNGRVELTDLVPSLTLVTAGTHTLRYEIPGTGINTTTFTLNAPSSLVINGPTSPALLWQWTWSNLPLQYTVVSGTTLRLGAGTTATVTVTSPQTPSGTPVGTRYAFDRWLDNNATTNPRTFTAPTTGSAATYSFAMRPEYLLSWTASSVTPSGAGTLSVDRSAGWYANATTATASLTVANALYRARYMTVNGATIGGPGPRSFSITTPTSVGGVFDECARLFPAVSTSGYANGFSGTTLIDTGVCSRSALYEPATERYLPADVTISRSAYSVAMMTGSSTSSYVPWIEQWNSRSFVRSSGTVLGWPTSGASVLEFRGSQGGQLLAVSQSSTNFNYLYFRCGVVTYLDGNWRDWTVPRTSSSLYEPSCVRPNTWVGNTTTYEIAVPLYVDGTWSRFGDDIAIEVDDNFTGALTTGDVMISLLDLSTGAWVEKNGGGLFGSNSIGAIAETLPLSTFPGRYVLFIWIKTSKLSTDRVMWVRAYRP